MLFLQFVITIVITISTSAAEKQHPVQIRAAPYKYEIISATVRERLGRARTTLRKSSLRIFEGNN